MNRFLLIGLALLLMLSSLGHVLAAAFCPRALGGECCFAKTHKHSSPTIHENMTLHHMHMDGMSMDGMNMDNMPMDAASMDHLAMNDVAIDRPIVDMSLTFSPAAFIGEAVANRFDQLVESCAHCLGHVGIFNAPVSFVSVSDQSGKEIRSVLLPVLRFLSPPAIALAQIGVPKEHAPPDSGAPRHILISVFLI